MLKASEPRILEKHSVLGSSAGLNIAEKVALELREQRAEEDGTLRGPDCTGREDEHRVPCHSSADQYESVLCR